MAHHEKGLHGIGLLNSAQATVRTARWARACILMIPQHQLQRAKCARAETQSKRSSLTNMANACLPCTRRVRCSSHRCCSPAHTAAPCSRAPTTPPRTCTCLAWCRSPRWHMSECTQVRCSRPPPSHARSRTCWAGCRCRCCDSRAAHGPRTRRPPATSDPAQAAAMAK
jgi:hypothetical protein